VKVSSSKNLKETDLGTGISSTGSKERAPKESRQANSGFDQLKMSPRLKSPL
jgi:hypothetical protein